MDNKLLSQIQQGKRLKKAVTNDRSAPQVGGGGAKPSGPPGGGMARPPPMMQHAAAAPPPTSSSNAPSGPQLGGLFAGGMPTLRKTRGSHVDTGREAAPSATPPSLPAGRPSVPKPPSGISQTLPRSFKPPTIPGRAPPMPPS
ncbi:hypothetical protein DM01DRAFT_323885, partial [Hesseltinella vesiculosa]